jgi:hypothetical protein
MGVIRLASLLAFSVVLSAAPAMSMLPTAEDFPRDVSTDPSDCDRILGRIDLNRPLVTQVPDADKLLEFLRNRRAGDIRRCLRERREGRRWPRKAITESLRLPKTPRGDPDLPELGARTRFDRPTPTKREFLLMLKTRPADAHQMLRRSNVPVGRISPIRQLPVGNRQLPVDTRQRAVGTW